MTTIPPRWAFEIVEQERSAHFGLEPNPANVDVVMADPNGWATHHAFAAYVERQEIAAGRTTIDPIATSRVRIEEGETIDLLNQLIAEIEQDARARAQPLLDKIAFIKMHERPSRLVLTTCPKCGRVMVPDLGCIECPPS